MIAKKCFFRDLLSLNMKNRVCPSMEAGLIGPTSSQLMSSPTAQLFISSISCWISFFSSSSLSRSLRRLFFLSVFHFIVPSLRRLARTQIRQGSHWNTVRISLAVTLVLRQSGFPFLGSTAMHMTSSGAYPMRLCSRRTRARTVLGMVLSRPLRTWDSCGVTRPALSSALRHLLYLNLDDG